MNKHFAPIDLACKCCGKILSSPQLILALNLLADICPEDLTIDSAYRCPKHNADIGGVPNSEHVQGLAVDISTKQLTPAELYLLAEQIPAFRNGGIGLYNQPFIHCDVRANRARWFRVRGKDHPIWQFITSHTAKTP